MKKICLHFSLQEHSRIKSKAALDGLSLMEVGKRLFLSWERDKEELNVTELGILKVGINKMIVNCYADIQRQSLEELSDKLDRMIDEENTRGE